MSRLKELVRDRPIVLLNTLKLRSDDIAYLLDVDAIEVLRGNAFGRCCDCVRNDQER